jgi:hypothetical protein
MYKSIKKKENALLIDYFIYDTKIITMDSSAYPDDTCFNSS